MGCDQTTEQQKCLQALMDQRAQLLRIAMSGISEIEQPALGRTVYRSLAEVTNAVRYLDELIANACQPPAAPAAMRRRRPIYPVVTEI